MDWVVKQHLQTRFSILMVLAAAFLALLPAGMVHAQQPSQGDSDAYVEALVDNAAPYIGEEITYIFRYYEAVDALRLPGILTGQPDYDAPEYANFWQEGEINQVNYQQNVNGRLYNVSELHTRLFPTAAGDLAISPAKLILDGGFSGRRIELATLPVTVGVKALPTTGDALTSGAVGDYHLTAQVDSLTTQVDEPITLNLTLSGLGNIRLAPVPLAPALDGWRVMEQSNKVEVEPMHALAGDSTDAHLGGTRTVSYLMIPSQAGDFTIPAIEYRFFDPVSGEVKSTTTEPISLQVAAAPGAAILPSDVQSLQQAPLAAKAAAVAPTVPVGEPDVSATDSAANDTSMQGGLPSPILVATLNEAGTPFGANPWYWGLWGLPIGAVALAGWGAWRRGRVVSNHASSQRARAGSDALRTMQGQHTASPAEMVGTAQRALVDFLGRKLNHPVTGLPRTTISAVLVDKGVQPSLAQQVAECLRLGDMARFSPAALDAYSAMQMQATVEATIRDLDRVL